MKNLKYILSLLFITTFLGCSDDENDTDFVNGVDAPSGISALFTITQDNTGKVTIRPNGSGVTAYEVNFGDGTAENAEIVPGESIDHIYSEGVYNVTITAMTINGKTTVYNQELTVTYRVPENVELTVTSEAGNPYKRNVSAKADFETYFEVYFGESATETPVQFNEGQTISHTYAAIGTYTIRLIAYSGGAATYETTETVTVFDPLLLPVNFESATLNYAFGDFGNSYGSVADNPLVSAGNSSARVGKIFKNPGAETWAGVTLALDEPIDFSVKHMLKMKVFSPKVGAKILLKLENLDNASINKEVVALTTVANAWQELLFDFNDIVNANAYQRLVIFYDFDVAGAGETFYFDDIDLASNAPDMMLVTFQDIEYPFTNFGNANTVVIDNPQANGINTSTKVGKLNKGAGAETWAGSFLEMAAPIDFSQHTKVKIKTWSPQAGIIVKLKFENFANSNINIEKDATTTVANGWEELTYDFSDLVNANNYQRVVVFFDFGNPGNGADYYFDDIKLSN